MGKTYHYQYLLSKNITVSSCPTTSIYQSGGKFYANDLFIQAEASTDVGSIGLNCFECNCKYQQYRYYSNFIGYCEQD
jgi:hypothetical protein